MDLIYSLTMLIPVILVAAFIIYIVKGYFLDGRDLKSLNIAAIVPTVVILIVAILVISPMAQIAAPFRFDADDGELTITKNLSQDPSYPWDSYAQDVTSVTIKSGVTSIAPNAFTSLTSLERVNIPDTLESIGTSAFGVTFKNPFGDNIDTLTPGNYVGKGDGTLYECEPELFTYSEDGTEVTGLTDLGLTATTLVIPATSPDGTVILAIGAGPDNASTLGGGAVTDVMFVSGSINNIKQRAFLNCVTLRSIDMPDTLTTLGAAAFSGCRALTSVELPSKLETVSYNVFHGCLALSSVTIPNSLTVIGTAMFSGCTALTSVELPSTLTEIRANAFDGCTSLSSIDIPASVKTIGAQAFINCTGITKVSFKSSFSGATVTETSFGSWTFYATNGTTELDKTDPAALAGSTFEGTAAALVKVQGGRSTLTADQILKVKELTELAGPIAIEKTDYSDYMEPSVTEPATA